MFGIGAIELLVIAVVALIVIGPQRLPLVARTVGSLLGRAQRYVNDVKREVGAQIAAQELRDATQSLQSGWDEVRQIGRNIEGEFDAIAAELPDVETTNTPYLQTTRVIQNEKLLRFRTQRANTKRLPQWYVKRQKIRRRLLSGAARVARYKP